MFNLPSLFLLLKVGYVVLILLIIFFLYKSIKKFLSLKQEQNDLLRELIKNMKS